jgi:hypothetical protein
MEKRMMEKETFYDRLLRRLKRMTDDDGNFVFPGDSEDIFDRTGSGLTDLLDYAFEKTSDKPIDYILFRKFLISDLNIPKHRVK